MAIRQRARVRPVRYGWGVSCALIALAAGVVAGLALLIHSAAPRWFAPSTAPAVGQWAVLVDQQGIPWSEFRRQLALFERLYTGPRAARESPAARAIQWRIEDRAVDQAIGEYLIVRAARRAHLSASELAVRETTRRMLASAGGPGQAQARWGITPRDVRRAATLRVLDGLLTRLKNDRHWLDRAARDARIVYYVGSRTGQADGPIVTTLLGHLGPGFVARDLKGRTVALADLAGQPVVLTLWATHCLWCGDDLVVLQEFAWRHRGVRVVAVDQGDSPAAVRAYLRGAILTLAVWLDEGSVSGGLYAPIGYPATYFIDRTGIVRDVVLGPLVDRRDLENRAAVLGGG